MANFYGAFFHGFQQVLGAQVLYHLLPGDKTIQASIGASIRVERAVFIQNVDAVDFLLMSRPHRVVIGIVGGRNLHTATAELRFGPLITDERHDAVEQWQADLAPIAGHLYQGEEGWEVGLTTAFETR